MGRILYISSHKTGHGHRSITEAVSEQLTRLDPSIEIGDLDGFMLSGKISGMMSRMYNKVVVNIPLLWKVYYQLGNVFPAVANKFTAAGMKKELLKYLDKNRPDLIVSVHPCYVSSVEDVLEEAGYDIPVISLVADLDNVSRLWADKRSLYTICPTENARKTMLAYGVPEDRVAVTGFPVRGRFRCCSPGKEGMDVPDDDRIDAPGKEGMDASDDDRIDAPGKEGMDASDDERMDVPGKEIASKGRLTFLIMNGSQGKKAVIKMARQLLDSFDCNVFILAGNNAKLKASTEKALQSYGGRVEICSFIKNVEDYMQRADILLLRASPNVMMEAVSMRKPMIITGALTGQEEKNPDFAEEHKLGVVCKNVRHLPEAVNKLLAGNGRLIDEIYTNQSKYGQVNAAEKIAEILLSKLNEIKGRKRC